MNFLILAVLIALVVGTGIALYLRANRIVFSLRTLLVATAVIALGLGGFLAWRSAGMAKITWLDPASAEAQQLSPASVVETVGDRFRLIYRTRNRHLTPLTSQIKWPASYTASFAGNQEFVKIESDDCQALDAALVAMQQADVLPPGKFAIRGVVIDAEGKPAAGATVDLLGNYAYINHFRTRDDGTFTMPLDAPAGSGYWLRIRVKDGPTRETRRFSLVADEPERVVRIEVD
jgi:hypothetical protein